jgi:uncharacterized protein (TIGR02117 family)
MVAAAVLALAACATAHGPTATVGAQEQVAPPVVIYVVKRGWHTDIGWAAADLHAPLGDLRQRLPTARYVFFGFGDRHYLLNHGGGSMGGLAGAVWPGAGLLLMTGVAGKPEQAFGVAGVIRLALSRSEASRLEAFVWKSLEATDGVARLLGPGPYEGSFYYAATARYSGLHTCNTWTAEGLKAAGLPIRSFAVEFSGQVWRQVHRVEQLLQLRTPVSLDAI